MKSDSITVKASDTARSGQRRSWHLDWVPGRNVKDLGNVELNE